MSAFARIAVLGALVPYAAGAQITVGPNVQVSAANSGRRHFEVLAAVDPGHSDRMLACSMALTTTTNARSVIVYASFDGGKTWTPTLEDRRSDFVGDPACVYGFGDTAYAATLPIMKVHGEAEMAIYRSTDGGRRWGMSAVRPFIDREYLAVDRSAGPNRGRVYLYANGERVDSAGKRLGAQLQFLRSTDGGRTFEGPVAAPTSEQYNIMIPAVGPVLADGRVVIPFMGLRDAHDTTGVIGVTIAESGGERLTTPVLINGSSTCRRRGAGVSLDAAQDRSDGPFRGRLYVVWSGGLSGRCEIMLAWSSDTGRTWSEPVRVSDELARPNGADGPDNTQPALAINDSGVVAVSWYDRRDHPSDRDADLRFSASMDGGLSFLPSVRVSAPPSGAESRELFAYTSGGGCRCRHLRGGTLVSHVDLDEMNYGRGDTRSMLADARGAFHPFWYDDRTGVTQLWTARVTVAGRASRNGSPSLDALRDVTDQVTIDYADTRYDARTHTVSVAAKITNTSDAVIRAPIKVRVLSLTSSAGVPRLVAPARDAGATGTVLDFGGAVPSGELRPGASSGAVRLRVVIADYRAGWHGPLDRLGKGLPSLLLLRSRVLAGGTSEGGDPRAGP